MGDELRFSPTELKMVVEQIVAESGSEDGKLSISELTSALSQAVRHDELKKFREATGRNVFGQLVVKK